MFKFDLEQHIRNRKDKPEILRALKKDEKVEWMKNHFGLSHGGTKKHKKKKKGRKK